jgi:hypothetical protein
MVQKVVLERRVPGLLFVCLRFAIYWNSQHVITALVVCWELALISNPASE